MQERRIIAHPALRQRAIDLAGDVHKDQKLSGSKDLALLLAARIDHLITKPAPQGMKEGVTVELGR